MQAWGVQGQDYPLGQGCCSLSWGGVPVSASWQISHLQGLAAVRRLPL